MGATVKAARVNIPQIGDLKTAITLYYTKISLSNTDIALLFPGIGNDRICTLKNLAREKAAEKNKLQWNSLTVLTPEAYEAWGLDIDDLEKRYTKLRKLGVET